MNKNSIVYLCQFNFEKSTVKFFDCSDIAWRTPILRCTGSDGIVRALTHRMLARMA
jgi:hypothetical protein